MVAINVILADSLEFISDALEKQLDAGVDLADAVQQVLMEIVLEHGAVIFNGNGYSDEWVKEAGKRGLPNITSTVASIPALITPESIRIFEKHHVLNSVELHSRAEITYESYIKVINIEARTMIDMTKKQIVPAVVKYTSSLAKSINSVKEAVPGADVSVQTELLVAVSARLAELDAALKKLEKENAAAAAVSGGVEKQAEYYRDHVFTAMSGLRVPADALEMMVDQDVWPFPTYGDLLFNV